MDKTTGFNSANVLPERTIPLVGLLPTTVILLVPLLFALWRVRSAPGRFVIGAVWLRLVMDAYSAYVVPPVAAGLSLNALASVAVVLIGVAMVGLRYLRLPWLVPVYVLVAVITLSALVNGVPKTMIEQTTKFAYLLLIVTGTYQAARDIGAPRFAGAMIVAYLPPIAFLLASLVFGISKAGESDGSVSYVGGYVHESIFSIAAAGGLIVAALATNVRWWAKVPFVLVVIASMLLANYRTTVVAMLPLIGWMAAIAPLGFLRRGSRPLAAGAGVLAFLALIATVNVNLGARVDSVIDFASRPGDFVRPADTFTREERSLNSGRAYVWSQYLTAYRDAAPLPKLVGHGPDSWETAFGGYAQNTILSYLYEFGALGAIAVTAIWLVMAIPLLGVPRRIVLPLALMHLAFFILNMSTMPFWQVEGILMYGLICGFTIAYARERRRSTVYRLGALTMARA